MPFPTKIQPIDSPTYHESLKNDAAAKSVSKSRLKRLFDRQFSGALRSISVAEKPTSGDAALLCGNDGDFDPSSLCLAKMVQNFIEESGTEKQSAKHGRSSCNCFNGNSVDSSDDDKLHNSFGSQFDFIPAAFCSDSSDSLKSLIVCSSVPERNLLADTSKIVEKNRNCKRKDELRKIISDGLLSLGYDASICKSLWEKSSSYPAGEYEYIDVVMEGERLLIDIDFRSEFEIARSTGNYKNILQSLPYIFVGKADRLQQILSVVSEAAKQSLTKKGMHLPPWRKLDYMRSKWLSPHTRTSPPPPSNDAVEEKFSVTSSESDYGDFDLIFGESEFQTVTSFSSLSPTGKSGTSGPFTSAPPIWQPPAIKPKGLERGSKVVTGLASLFEE